MMKKFYLLLFLLPTQYALLGTLYAQPVIKWNKSYGGNGGEDTKAVFVTQDGNYLVSGVTTTTTNGDVSGGHGNADYWLIKINTAGKLLWQKSIGGSFDDAGGIMAMTKDGGSILTGSSSSTDGDATNSGNHGYADFWVVKVDTAGKIQWQKAYGSSGAEVAYSIKQTPDKGYVFAGASDGSNGDITATNKGMDDWWIVKTDSLGALKWQKSFGGSKEDQAKAVVVLNDGSALIAGYSQSSDGDFTSNHGLYDDGFIVKFNALGNVKWLKAYGGTAQDDIYAIKQTRDGGFVFTGSTSSNDGDNTGLTIHGYYDAWVVKLDTAGKVVWSKNFGGSSVEAGFDVMQDKDGGFIVVGKTASNDGDVKGFGGNEDMWMFKVDSLGNLLWQKCLGGSQNETGGYIAVDHNNNYVLAGYDSNNDTTLITDTHGGGDFWVVQLQCATPTLTLAKQDVACFGGNTGAVSPQITGGAPSFKYKWSNGATTAVLSGVSAGTYSVTLSDELGNSATASVVLTEPSELKATTTATKSGGSNGTASVTVTGGTPSYTYIWNNAKTTASISGLAAGTYYVTVQDKNGCVIKDTAIVKSNVGIAELSTLQEIKLWPNPITAGILHIEGAKNADWVALYNILGEKVMQGNAAPTIDVSAIPTGVYTLVISNKENRTMRKVIIQ